MSTAYAIHIAPNMTCEASALLIYMQIDARLSVT